MPTGLGDEVLWYSATVNGDGTNMGSYTSTDMELKPFNSSATIETFDNNGNVSFQSAARLDNWTTDQNFNMYSGQSDNMTIAFWLAADTMELNAPIFGFGRRNTYQSEVLLAAKNNQDKGLLTARQTDGRKTYQTTNTFIGRYGLNPTHIAMTWGKGTGDIKIYKNGVLSYETGGTGGSIGSDAYTTSCRFGSMLGGSSGGSAGQRLEDMRFFKRELTADEIAWLAVAPNLEGPAPVGLGGEKMWLCPSINDSPYDISGSGNNGTYLSGVGTVADANMGGTLAYELDGTNDNIRIYDGGLNGGGGFADFLNSTDNWSFSVYAKTSGNLSNGGAKQTLLGGRQRQKMAGVSFGINSSYGSDYDLSWKPLESSFSGNSINWNNNPSVDSDWHHVCYVNDGGTVSLYVDGVASAVTRTKTSDANGIVTSFLIGAGGGESIGSYFKGRMDDVRLFDRTITQAEITHLATARGVEGPAGSGPDPPTPSGRVYNPFLSHTFHTLTGQRIR